ncbi:MAG: TRAP transporter small permease [Pseudomonadota bacterium]
MGSLANRIAAALAVLAAGLLIFVTLSISYAILTRVLGWKSPIWVIQFNEYALLWITFLAAAWLLGRNKHVSIDLVTGRLSPGWKHRMAMVHAAMGTGVCGILAYYGTLTVWGQFQRNVIDVKGVDVPKYLVLLVIPLGFGLLAFQFLCRFIQGIRPAQTGMPENVERVQGADNEPESPPANA